MPRPVVQNVDRPAVRRGGCVMTFGTRTVIVLLASLWLALAGLVSLGYPGAVILRWATDLAGWFSPAQLGDDEVWPTALAISALGPFALLPADLVARRVRFAHGATVLLTVPLALLIVVAGALGIVLGAG